MTEPTQAQIEAARLLDEGQVTSAFELLNAEIDRLTAATEAEADEYMHGYHDGAKTTVDTAIDATIERCARLAEGMSQDCRQTIKPAEIGQLIAAAIRARGNSKG